MGGEAGRMRALPLLPAGDSLFTDLPARAIVLDALAPAVADGIISLVDGNSTAVLVVRDGAVADAVAVANGARETGDAAMVRARSWESAAVSCWRLTVEAMSLIDPLLHGEIVYSDLRLEWTAWSDLLLDLRNRGQTFIVELHTPNDRGVTVIREGEQIATYSESQPALGGTDVLDGLAAGGQGSIRVFAESASPKPVTESAPEPRAAAVAVAALVSVPTSSGGAVTVATPAARDDDANATLSALFGEPFAVQPFAPTIVHERSDPPPEGVVDSLVPELKRLARQRLQRSSTPVEDAIDLAASESQSVEWLVARVRVMRVRGFVPETFEHLADAMQELARSPMGAVE